MSLKQMIAATQEEVASKEAQVKEKRFLMGFDAFIDEISEMVDERKDFKHYSKLKTISDFGHRILGAAGLSNSMEMVPQYLKTGGSAVNMGSSVYHLGGIVDYIGCIGYPDVHPVFAEFAESVNQAYNIADPGYTLALEFQDGKIMICNTQPLRDITWDRISETVGLETFGSLIAQADVVGSINWTMTPYMDAIWQKMQTELLPAVQFERRDPIFFVDPIDPAKRDNQDIVQAMARLAGFSNHFRTVLSLNRKEATEVGKAFGLDLGVPLPEAPLEAITRELYRCLDLYGLLVHPVDCAACMWNGEYYEAPGPYAKEPRLTTGAGDNFNAGFVVATLLGLSPTESLVLGNAVSGFYVRQAKNPTFAELVTFMDTWQDNWDGDF